MKDVIYEHEIPVIITSPEPKQPVHKEYKSSKAVTITEPAIFFILNTSPLHNSTGFPLSIPTIFKINSSPIIIIMLFKVTDLFFISCTAIISRKIIYATFLTIYIPLPFRRHFLVPE